MGKRRFTEGNWRREPWLRALCTALLSIKTEQGMAAFLRDIGTLSELQAWGERWQVAQLLSRGVSYRDIAKKTGASTATVTRVAKFLENGEGYRSVLKNYQHHHAPARRGERMVSKK